MNTQTNNITTVFYWVYILVIKLLEICEDFERVMYSSDFISMIKYWKS